MIDKKDIKNIAYLARLEIEENQLDLYGQNLSKALAYFNEISQINTTGVTPMITPIEFKNFLREDKVEPHFESDEMVRNAPDKLGNLFKVPPVV